MGIKLDLDKSTEANMRFRQIDAITALEPGKRIEAKKLLTGKEDYLKDHFPRFAVMPGVLMLESLYQAANLLVRSAEDFKAGLVIMKGAKNVKFADFVQPGQVLEIEAEIFKRDGDLFTVKATGKKGDELTVSGRIIIQATVSQNPSLDEQFAAQYMRQLTHRLQTASIS